jgi:hypothetical protein
MRPHESAQNRAPSYTPCLTVDATNQNDFKKIKSTINIKINAVTQRCSIFRKKHYIKITRLCNQHKHVQSFATDHNILLKVESCLTTNRCF